MIISAKQAYGVSAVCGMTPVGTVDDLLFDDRSWSITQIVIRTGDWPARKRVLILPRDVQGADWSARRLRLGLTEQQVHTAPTLESHPPVALQDYQEIQRFVAWDAYWAGVFDGLPEDDVHLRNTRAVTGHHVFGLDGEVGYVDNFVIEDATWSIRYLVVRMGMRRDARRVLVEPRWVEAIDWQRRGVHVHLAASEIEQATEFAGKA